MKPIGSQRTKKTFAGIHISIYKTLIRKCKIIAIGPIFHIYMVVKHLEACPPSKTSIAAKQIREDRKTTHNKFSKML